MSRAHGQNSGLFSIAPGVEPETRSIDRRSVTSLTQLRHRSSRPRAPARNHLVALEPGPEPSVDAESDACEFVRSKSLWNQTDSGFLGCGFAADKFGDRGGGGRRRLTRPLALDGDSTFQTAATRRHGFSISRRDLPEVCQQCPYPPKQRAQGIPGARCTRGPVSNVHKKHAHEQTGSAEAIRHSLRSGFTLIPCSPRRSGLGLSPSPALLDANLTPAMRRQDHTISPYASALCVQQRFRVHRIPVPRC